MIALDAYQPAAPAARAAFACAPDALGGVGRDIEIAMMTDEPCACAAVDPDMTGQKEPYQRDK